MPGRELSARLEGFSEGPELSAARAGGFPRRLAGTRPGCSTAPPHCSMLAMLAACTSGKEEHAELSRGRRTSSIERPCRLEAVRAATAARPQLPDWQGASSHHHSISTNPLQRTWCCKAHLRQKADMVRRGQRLVQSKLLLGSRAICASMPARRDCRRQRPQEPYFHLSTTLPLLGPSVGSCLSLKPEDEKGTSDQPTLPSLRAYGVGAEVPARRE